MLDLLSGGDSGVNPLMMLGTALLAVDNPQAASGILNHITQKKERERAMQLQMAQMEFERQKFGYQQEQDQQGQENWQQQFAIQQAQEQRMQQQMQAAQAEAQAKQQAGQNVSGIIGDTPMYMMQNPQATGLLGQLQQKGELDPVTEQRLRAAKEVSALGDYNNALSLLPEPAQPFVLKPGDTRYNNMGKVTAAAPFEPSYGQPQEAMIDGRPSFVATDKTGNVKDLGIRPVNKDMVKSEVQSIETARNNTKQVMSMMPTLGQIRKTLDNISPLAVGQGVGYLSPYLDADVKELEGLSDEMAIRARVLLEMPSGNFSNTDLATLKNVVTNTKKDKETLMNNLAHLERIAAQTVGYGDFLEQKYQRDGNLIGANKEFFESQYGSGKNKAANQKPSQPTNQQSDVLNVVIDNKTGGYKWGK